MLPLEPVYLVLLPVSLAAGFVRGFSGFGGPLLMLPILTHYLTPADSIWISLWVDLLVNLRLLPEVRRQVCRSVLLPIVLGALATLPLGVKLMAGTDPELMKRAIGGAIFIAALVLLSGWRYPSQPGHATWLGVGLFSGLVFGATSLAVPLMLFLSADRQSAAQVRANFIVWVFIATVALLVLLVTQGALRAGNLTLITMLAPLYFVGTIAGAQWQGVAPERAVRLLVLLLAAAIGGVSAVA